MPNRAAPQQDFKNCLLCQIKSIAFQSLEDGLAQGGVERRVLSKKEAGYQKRCIFALGRGKRTAFRDAGQKLRSTCTDAFRSRKEGKTGADFLTIATKG